MNVLIVNTTLHTGGASIAAGRLAEALRGAGCAVRVLTRGHRVSQRLQFVWERLEALYYTGFDYPNVFAVDHGGCGTDITRLPDFEWADVVHLHWINQAMLGLRDIKTLVVRCRQENKRLVWTLHDIWPATGICHLPGDCGRWMAACGDCPKLKRNALTRLLPLCGRSQHDVSERVFRKKRQIYREGEITFVACSKYLAGLVRRSPLMQGQEVVDIANPLDTDFFSPSKTQGERRALRERLSLPAGKTIVLFVAYNVDDGNKGFGFLADAVDFLTARRPDLLQSLCVVAVGKNATAHRRRFRCEMQPFEYVSDRGTMCDLYRTADFFAMPSLMENLPNTIAEAKACGLPVVASRVGGIVQMVRHGIDGYLVPPADSAALSAALETLLLHPRRHLLSAEARNDAVETYSTAKVARRYMELYRGIF